MKGYFVTGTGTGVGKTVAAALLLRALRRAGLDAVPVKPVQTGAAAGPEGTQSEDLAFCLAAAGIAADSAMLEGLAPWRFAEACSPHLAAARAGARLTAAALAAAVRNAAAGHDAAVVEGAGGVLVPLNARETALDLIAALGLPAVVVAHAGLGTINHTLLTLRALRGAGCTVAGVVYSEADGPGPDYIAADNPSAIAAFDPAPDLGRIPYRAGLCPEEGMLAELEAAIAPGLARLVDAMRQSPPGLEQYAWEKA